MANRSSLPPQQSTDERSSRTEQGGRPAAEEQRPVFGTPWTINEFCDVVTAQGEVVVNPFRANLENRSPTATFDFMRRIVACVNACEGIPTGVLEFPLSVIRAFPATAVDQ